ncbi:MAG: hypothetical protein R3C99_19340 [Pirellulaceae bacterium]
MIVSPDGRSLKFVPYSGRFAADDYTLTLGSRPDAFTTTIGEQLDGDNDGLPGGDSIWSFAISSATGPSMRLPNLARGPGQTIDLGGSGGIPIAMDDAAGVTGVGIVRGSIPTATSSQP